VVDTVETIYGPLEQSAKSNQSVNQALGELSDAKEQLGRKFPRRPSRGLGALPGHEPRVRAPDLLESLQPGSMLQPLIFTLPFIVGQRPRWSLAF
jgi:hypothetical protein